MIALGVWSCKCVKQVSDMKQCEPQSGTPEIDVVANALLKPPIHPRKQVKSFGNMTEYDHHQAFCTE
jgi:hypothetical protein